MMDVETQGGAPEGTLKRTCRCGESFYTKRKTKRFCSAKCRKDYWFDKNFRPVGERAKPRIPRVKKERPTWVVCEGGSLTGVCLRCGERYTHPLPASVYEWCSAMKKFVKLHEKCEAKEQTNENG